MSSLPHRDQPASDWRHTYVVRQISTARLALDRGHPAAARAALRTLAAEDFALPAEATRHLRVLRNRDADDEHVLAAIRRLSGLAPRPPRGVFAPRPDDRLAALGPPASVDPPVDGRPALDGLRRAARLARQEQAAPTPTSHTELHRTTVEAQQALLRHALRMGDLDLVRRAARALRVADFAAESAAVEGLLGVLRDARSAPDDSFDAALRIAALAPA